MYFCESPVRRRIGTGVHVLPLGSRPSPTEVGMDENREGMTSSGRPDTVLPVNQRFQGVPGGVRGGERMTGSPTWSSNKTGSGD